MKLGFAEIDITPNRPLALAGFAGDVRMGRRGERPLLAQAAFFRGDRGKPVLFFAVDVIGFEQKWTDQLRARLHRRTGIPVKHIILNASHTHCGPATIHGLQPPSVGVVDDAWLAELQAQLLELGCAAARAAAPAQLRVCAGTNTQVTHRRRWNGTNWINAPNYSDEPIRDLPILDCQWQNGRRLLITIVSGHPTTAAETNYDPHYIGLASERIRNELGKRATLMILQGVTGDSKMTTPNPVTGGWIRDMKEDIRIASAKITADILRALPFGVPIAPVFRVASKTVRLSQWKGLGRDVPTKRALAMLANRRTVASWNKLRTGRFIPYEMQILSFTDQYRWVMLGGEPCTDVGRRVKAVFKDGATFVAGYCNDMPSYIPSARVAVEGGYEGRTSFAVFSQHPLHPDTEDRIARGVKEMKRSLSTP